MGYIDDTLTENREGADRLMVVAIGVESWRKSKLIKVVNEGCAGW